MKFEEYSIESITNNIRDIYTVRLKPKYTPQIPAFKPGQFFHIKNPTFENPNHTKPFSVTTTPFTTTYLEFCIKPYGIWTEQLLRKKKGESLWLFGPMGSFTLRDTTQHAVFIAGGIGITPIFSMLQSLHLQKHPLPVTLIYANKTPEHIFKKAELEDMLTKNVYWKLHHIISSVQGRITTQILQKYTQIQQDITFYISGSYQFTKNIVGLLEELGVEASAIKQEIFSPPVVTAA